jgi:hypothetical protein
VSQAATQQHVPSVKNDHQPHMSLPKDKPGKGKGK